MKTNEQTKKHFATNNTKKEKTFLELLTEKPLQESKTMENKKAGATQKMKLANKRKTAFYSQGEKVTNSKLIMDLKDDKNNLSLVEIELIPNIKTYMLLGYITDMQGKKQEIQKAVNGEQYQIVGAFHSEMLYSEFIINQQKDIEQLEKKYTRVSKFLKMLQEQIEQKRSSLPNIQDGIIHYGTQEKPQKQVNLEQAQEQTNKNEKQNEKNRNEKEKHLKQIKQENEKKEQKQEKARQEKIKKNLANKKNK